MPRGRKKQEGNGDISMMEAVRRALSSMGSDAKPLALKTYIWDNFSKAMSPGLISNYKSSIRKKESGKSRMMRRVRSAATTAAAAASSYTVDDVKAVKELAERIGPEKLRELAKVFG